MVRNPQQAEGLGYVTIRLQCGGCRAELFYTRV
jgi:hypothetical protein